MNRVVLCGRLAERPRLSTSPTGLTVALLRLQVPRQGLDGLFQAMDVIDCLAFDVLARELYLRASPEPATVAPPATVGGTTAAYGENLGGADPKPTDIVRLRELLSASPLDSAGRAGSSVAMI